MYGQENNGEQKVDKRLELRARQIEPFQSYCCQFLYIGLLEMKKATTKSDIAHVRWNVPINEVILSNKPL